MTTAEFDAVFKKALIESVLDGHAEMIADAEKQIVVFSRNYLGQKARMLRNPAGFFKKRKQLAFMKVLLVAALFLTAIAAGASLLP